MLFKLIGRYIRPYRRELIAVLILQLISAVASLLLPSLNASIIDDGVATGDTGFILNHGAIMLSVALVQGLCQIAAVYFAARIAMSFGRDVRAGVFDKTLSFSVREMNQFGAPSLITRSTNDVQQVQMLILMTCAIMITAPMTMIGGVVMALREDVGLSWLIVVAVILLGTVVGIIVARMTPLFQANQRKIDSLNQVVREQITGIRVIRAFNREPLERERFRAANDSLMQLGYAIGGLFAVLFPFVMLVMNMGSVSVMWFGGHRVDSGEMEIGQLTAYLTYLMQILMSVLMATMMGMMAPRAVVCAERIMEVLNTDTTVVPPANPVTALSQTGTVRFENVEFSYPGAEAPVLSGISFELRPGQTTAVVGSTGAGKTTLVNLIPRLFDATGGRVLVDGVDVREIDPDLLWSRIGLVPQKPYLFSGTVASNMRYGRPDATDEQLWEALTIAQAADFVSEMDLTVDAAIAQGGTNVSGGQRQRLSIARALVKRPEIYVFDDAFSALDVATDARLRAALGGWAADASVLIVAQRISTVRQADQIIVLDDGTIAGIGTHEELMDSCQTYREIVESQLSVEEAA
ncbi:ABC transporter ATP-binding protein [Brooklawnia sp.]|uniref:ABC transporter ATP-binding protein n=1 Tax=Brooklawnia sp. TaxID=2699740 RepID=UPI00311D9D64